MSKKIAIFSPSHYCNSQCWMCTDLWTDIDSFVEPNFDYICSEAKALRDTGVTSLHISGGEPTVWRKFDDFISYVATLGFDSIAVYSNGRTLTSRKIRHCLENGVKLFLISLHASNSEEGDTIAKAPGSFKQTLKGLENLSKLKEEYTFEISISCVPSKYTENSVYNMAKLASTFNIDNFHISYPVNTSVTNLITEKNFPDLKKMKTQIENVINLLHSKNIHPVINEIPPCYYKSHPEYYSAVYEHSEERVLIGFHSINGKVRKDSYTPLRSSSMNFHPAECDLCFLRDKCYGIPKVYQDQYTQGELDPFSYEDVLSIVNDRD